MKSIETRQLINNGNLFPTVLEAEKSKIKIPALFCSDENPLPGLVGVFLTVLSHSEKDEESLEYLFIRILISFVRVTS